MMKIYFKEIMYLVIEKRDKSFSTGKKYKINNMASEQSGSKSN